MEPLIVPGTVESLAAVSDYLRTATAAAGLDKAGAYRLKLAVVELVTNSIEHGYAGRPDPGPVELRAVLTPTELRVVIEDEAPPFDPRSAPPPDDLHLPPEERGIGGLGVFLVLDDVDRFEYERAGGRNRCTVVARRPAGGTS